MTAHSLDRRSKAFARALLLLALACALLISSTSPGSRIAQAAPTLREEIYVAGIEKPSDIVWLPGTDRLFVSEEDTGKIRLINNGRLLDRPCVNLDVEKDGDGGLQGILLHPRFGSNHFIYAFYSHEATQTNRLTRFTVEKGRCTDPTEILWDLGLGPMHQGGQLAWSGGKLYVTTGDNRDNPALAQERESLQGKVLRLNPNGGVPASNPTWDGEEPSPVWSLGHRNGFGLARGPAGEIYETENGHLCDDELNLIQREANYGWGPEYACYDPETDTDGSVGPDPTLPLFRWESVVAPTDAYWYEGPLAPFDGSLVVTDWIKGQVHRFRFPDDEVRHKIMHNSARKLISVTKGPGGWLYMTARKRASSDFGKVIRLVSP